MKKTDKLCCPICGSEKLNKVDELNPDYVCCSCGEILFGLTFATLEKIGRNKQNKEPSLTLLVAEESCLASS
jgi:transcription initiation factor TFIIIB Brf1 subunit/transcription initiation factor TFIIB